MPKPVKPKPMRVIITDHALARWQQRANRPPRKKTQLESLVGAMLYTKLRTGGLKTTDLAVELDMGGGIYGILRLGNGAWVCTTFIIGESSEAI